MTNEEAIRQLNNLKEHCSDFVDKNEPDCVWSKDVIALDMAIAALQEKTQALKVICGVTGTACVDCKGGSCEARRMGVPSDG